VIVLMGRTLLKKTWRSEELIKPTRCFTVEACMFSIFFMRIVSLSVYSKIFVNFRASRSVKLRVLLYVKLPLIEVK
jgi:hypothetical protein